MKEKMEGKTIGESYTKKGVFSTNVNLDFNGGVLPVPQYDDSSFQYESLMKSVIATEEETAKPEFGEIIKEPFEKGKVIGETGIKLFTDIITYNELSVEYNNLSTYYGAGEEESEKPKKGKIITSF